MLKFRLKQLRKKCGMTQSALAGELYITQQAVAKWEAGRALPAPGMIPRIAGFFGVTADYLLDMADRFAAPGPVSQVRIVGAVKAGYDGFAFEEELGFAPAEVKNAEEYRRTIAAHPLDEMTLEDAVNLYETKGMLLYCRDGHVVAVFREQKQAEENEPLAVCQ